MSQKCKFDPQVVAACKEYSKARRECGSSQWRQAQAAMRIKNAAEKARQPYIKAAVQLCGATMPQISMETKAEQMRIHLKHPTNVLPPDSLSAFYELHRGREVALKIAKNEVEKRVIEEHIKTTAQRIIKRELSHRDVRALFRKERAINASLNTHKCRPVAAEDLFAVKPPMIERLDVERLKAKFDEVIVPAGLCVPLVTIVPAESTPTAIDAYLAEPELRAKIAAACPARGKMLILVDLNAAKSAMKTGTVKTAPQAATLASTTSAASDTSVIADDGARESQHEMQAAAAPKIATAQAGSLPVSTTAIAAEKVQIQPPSSASTNKAKARTRKKPDPKAQAA
ncbi:MAG TPA: hypothetical protein VGP72_05430 [Planctomycetota bacterium]|jgi:hypothetical protein